MGVRNPLPLVSLLTAPSSIYGAAPRRNRLDPRVNLTKFASAPDGLSSSSQPAPVQNMQDGCDRTIVMGTKTTSHSTESRSRRYTQGRTISTSLSVTDPPLFFADPRLAAAPPFSTRAAAIFDSSMSKPFCRSMDMCLGPVFCSRS